MDKVTIFIFDWCGTLDILDDTYEFLKDLKEHHPGCIMCLNTGLLGGVSAECADVFDHMNSKTQEFTILSEVITEIDHWAKVCNTVSAKAVDRVVIVDDQYDMSFLKSLQIRLERYSGSSIPVHAFHDVGSMQIFLNTETDG